MSHAPGLDNVRMSVLPYLRVCPYLSALSIEYPVVVSLPASLAVALAMLLRWSYTRGAELVGEGG